MIFDRLLLNFLLLLVGLFVSYETAMAGQNVDHQIDLFNKYQEENYEELVYAQTDKNHYLTGERIKVKVNCLEKATSKFSKLSKVAYIEVLDAENSPLIQTKIGLIDGSGYGEIFIPTNINSGNFVLRAYTRWMRNYGPATFFHTGITIINPFKRLGLQPVADSTGISIQFFPEGTGLIDGLKTKVVFDCQNSTNEPIAFAGKLLANDSVLISTFSPYETGIGSFELVPDIELQYHVEIQQADGVISRHDFLPIEEKGISFQAHKINETFILDFICNDPELVVPSDLLFLMIHQNGKVVAEGNTRLIKGAASIELEIDDLEDGIAVITLFSSDGRFLQQRQLLSSYTDRKQPILISKREYQQREKAEIDLSEFLPDGSLETTDISVTVSTYQENLIMPQMALDDYLLVANSLNDQIFRLGKVFEGNSNQVSTVINDLLVAYGDVDTCWLANIPKHKFILEYRAPLITGKVVNKNTNEPEFGLNVYISVVGKNVRFNSTRSRNDGSLIFEMENLYGSNELVVQTDYTKDTISSIEIDNPFSTEYLDVKIPVFNIDEELETWIKVQSQYMQVRNAYSRYKPKLPFLNELDTSAFYNEPDSRYYLDDFTRFIVMEEVMREYISGVNVRKNSEGFHFMVLDLDRNEIFSENPLMLLDGVPIFDADEIIALDPLKIEKIETIKRRFHKGYLDCFGIVNFTSYNGNLDGHNLSDHSLVIKYDGLQMKKQYHFPSYASAVQKRNTSPDFRDLLYWNPEYQVKEGDDKSIEFYTSDETNSYQVIVNAITEGGQPYSGKAVFKVLPENNN